MKNILIAFIASAGFNYASSQSITFDNPIALKWPTRDSTANLSFYITNNPSQKNYTIKVSDLFSGTALQDKDYELSSTKIKDLSGKGKFSIVVKPALKKIRRTINIFIQAVSEATSFSSVMQVTLTHYPPKVKPIDKTNTTKFEFVNYTDFKGYDPDQPNGIAQSQFLFKLPINKYYKAWNDGETKEQWFRSVIMPNFIFNRIDKSDQLVSLRPFYTKYGDSITVSPIINTFDFVASSNFILNSKLVVYTIIRPKARFQFQLNGSLFKIKIDSGTVTKSLSGYDSVSSKKDTITALNPVWASALGAELYYDTHFTDEDFPFNFRFILGVSIIKNRSSEYKQADIAYTSPGKSTSTAILLEKTHRRSAPVWNFSAMISKNLGIKKDNNSEDHFLFFRYTYTWQTFNGRVLLSKNPVRSEARRFTNNFSQFQLGLDMNFDTFFK